MAGQDVNNDGVTSSGGGGGGGQSGGNPQDDNLGGAQDNTSGLNSTLSTSRSDIFAMFPWMEELGFTSIVDELLEQDITDPSVILGAIRRSARHRELFPGMVGPDGVLRVDNEKMYRDRMSEYRQVLRDHNIDVSRYTNFELARFLDDDIDLDPNELGDRLTLYKDLTRSGRHIRDAFYVYAGIRMSDDDLYTYVVDPNARLEFDGRYTQQVTTNPPDYATFITRATEAGLDAVAQSLRDLEEQGVAISGAASIIQKIDPAFARTITDLLMSAQPVTNTLVSDDDQTGYDESGVIPESRQQMLSLDELTAALEYALIGGAASQQGLAIPGLDRIAEIRQAGITRAQALEGYRTFATQKNLLQAQVARLNEGRRSFTQSDFEEAVFLQNATESDLLQRAAAREASFGRAQGNVGFSTDRYGRLVQAGFTPSGV